MAVARSASTRPCWDRPSTGPRAGGRRGHRRPGGTLQRRGALQQYTDAADDYAIALELQADCYAGIWAALADANEGEGIVLTREDVAQANGAAEAVGDDRIQEATTGQVTPETWTHGSAEQRREWFERGLDSGDLATCDTFA